MTAAPMTVAELRAYHDRKLTTNRREVSMCLARLEIAEVLGDEADAARMRRRIERANGRIKFHALAVELLSSVLHRGIP